jgi:amino acid adenylation domain-containing protein
LNAFESVPGEYMLSGFLRSSRQFANAEAICIGDRSYSYSEVRHISGQWATRLAEITSGKPGRIGILSHRNAVSYLGMLAAMLAGCVYVPLKPTLPEKRLHAMVRAADLAAIIAEEGASNLASQLAESNHLPVLMPLSNGSASIAADGRRFLTAADCSGDALSEPVVPASRAELAYLLFTSGSTGVPKAIGISQGSVRSFLDTCNARYDFGPGDRFSQTFDQTFDLSLFELFMAWEAGASVQCPYPNELLAPGRYVDRAGITIWFSVPSVALLMQKRGDLRQSRLEGLRWSLFCGEAMSSQLAAAWQTAAPNSILENLYGPTELTIACSSYRWDAKRSPGDCLNGIVPIGKVFDNHAYAIVDANGRPVDPGQSGELVVSGPQQMLGYYGDKQRTTQSMIALGDDESGSSRTYYRTGDIVRRHNDQLHWTGRIDHQIKLAGYRIELAEIEGVLLEAGCLAAVVAPWPADAPMFLLAAVVADAGASETQLRTALAAHLPGYMIPRKLFFVESLPLNENGKIDRGAVLTMLTDIVRTSGESETHAN